jgi:hypothetical protein
MFPPPSVLWMHVVPTGAVYPTSSPGPTAVLPMFVVS